MKKTNPMYIVTWYGIPLALAAAFGAAGWLLKLDPLILIAVILLIATPIVLSPILKKRMDKCAAKLEKEFPNVNYKFTSHNSIIYLDTEGGHAGVVWKYNPAQLQMIDPEKITNIRTNNGKQLRGTSLVSCQFLLDGHKIKIYTLRVSNGQLAMNDPRVLEAISKADMMCEMLQTVKIQAQTRK